ncbi:DNA cytosine methyltransferase, partial [Pseudomonas sp. MD195_PC81_125]|uniref:DNA cytosine methyltransferase n=1 Tax=Pseudomonas sp. MD195_PC81_125 TaxID=2741560 RepID=UPI001C70BB3F
MRLICSMRHSQKKRIMGLDLKEGSEEFKALYKLYVPPYDPTKFPNKWRKMEADKPARTLMAHLGKDGYSHIHYDSTQARTISVREAARLQSFPDGFTFSGSMNPAFKQVGNAVPPLLSFALATEIMRNIR